MTSLVRTIQALTPNSPYATMLKTEFGVEVPPSAPRYQQEYLYKYCLVLKNEKTPVTEIVTKASVKVDEFVKKYPWALLKYEDVVKSSSQVKKVRTEKVAQADGTIVFCEKRGIFLLYVGGQIMSRGKTVEKVKELATKKHGFTSFAQ